MLARPHFTGCSAGRAKPSRKVHIRLDAAVDRGNYGEYITPSTGRWGLSSLASAVWCSRQAMGSAGIAGRACCGRESKSIGWAAFLSRDSWAGSLTIWLEEREAWTARSLRTPLESSDLEWRLEETSAVHVFSENSQLSLSGLSLERGADRVMTV